jgi:hypothetical protein
MNEHQKTTQVILSSLGEPREHQKLESIALFVEVEPGVYENLLSANSETLTSIFTALADFDERITALEEA